MEKITTKNQLIILVENLICVEKLARDRYLDESFKFESEEITTVLKEIKSDEDRHIKMLEDLIKSLKNK